MGEYGENEAGQQESSAVNEAVDSAGMQDPIFFGSYERALDDKGRFNVPFRFRKKDLAKEEEPPRFAKRFLDGASEVKAALGDYCREVRDGTFPGASHRFD